MAGRRYATTTAIATLALAALVLSAPAAAHQNPTQVAAAGNIFTGGLEFDPAEVRVKLGGGVQWTNTDFLVPHTATEDHELWDLSGNYGGTPLNPPGFGPGESRERHFEAGTWSYFCRVHPEQMRGEVSVPMRVRARKARKAGRRRYLVTARWSFTKLPGDQVYDVQSKRGSGPWRLVSEDTRQLFVRLRKERAGQVLAFRARLHRAGDETAASGWSPTARVRLR